MKTPPAFDPTEFRHAAGKLDFGQLLEVVAAGAVAERSRDEICNSLPLDSPEAVERSQDGIVAFAALAEAGETAPIGGWRDTRPILEGIVAPGTIVGAEELVSVARGERTAAAVADFLSAHAAELPAGDAFAQRYRFEREIVRRIERAIGPDLEVLDAASRDLARIRRDTVALRARLRRAAAGVVAEHGRGRGEEFVTLRGDRYVLALPRAEAGRVRGIVHQESGSGASLYIEPLSFVEENNQVESLVQEERREIERVLRELTSLVREARTQLLFNQEMLGTVDVLSAKAAFARRYRCVKPVHSANGEMRLFEARHPLLERAFSLEGGDRRVSPLEIGCDAALRVLVVSGPNAGGKTVALKTVGLLVLMDRAGLPLPCREGSILPWYRDLFVDIGDDQSIEMSLSTFSSRIGRMKRILELADRDDLVLVDEIGDGTDPEEGGAIAEAMLERLADAAGRTIVTTHLGRLKGWAHETGGAANASLEFDDKRLEPLFRFRMGVPGRSWGIEMAGRMGLPVDVIESAKKRMSEENLRLEELLADLERMERVIGEERKELLEKKRLLTELVDRYRERIDDIEKNRGELEERARREALDIVSGTRREMERLVREIRSSGAEKTVIRRTRERIGERRKTFEGRTRPRERRGTLSPGEVVEGMTVGIISIGKTGRVVSAPDRGRVLVELDGGIRVETKASDLERGPAETQAGRRRGTVSWSAGPDGPVETELMIRGLERAEALEKVDAFIDRAVLAGLGEVSIIHGIGRGILKRAVYDTLRGDPRVAGIHPGEPAFGGDGVAVVKLK
ncbi:MAG: Smr/MutS family protein [Candidatus Krumholzibacteriota bacterium]|nr:Smr/MutS family protein [Candidatus Krumholzibacteriota bacterium]